MAAFTDAAARFGSAGTSSNGTADEAAQRLLPSPGGDVEMSAVAADAFGGGGAARRRATVLKRLESLDPAIRGKIDNQQLVRCGAMFSNTWRVMQQHLCAVHFVNRSTRSPSTSSRLMLGLNAWQYAIGPAAKPGNAMHLRCCPLNLLSRSKNKKGSPHLLLSLSTTSDK